MSSNIIDKKTSRRIKLKIRESLEKALGSAVLPLGYRLQRLNQPNPLEALLYKRLYKTSKFFFIQIGANDGISADPIYSFVTRNNVEGIVVEPLKDIFRELVFNYRKYPQIKKVNAAIHSTKRSHEIYRVNPNVRGDFPHWTKLIASFDKDHHKLSNTPSEFIVCEEVSCISFQELIQENYVKKIDLLQIDTEGYDYEIIKMIDFHEIKPHIIHFEHRIKAGVMSRDEFQECMNYLYAIGYFVLMTDSDAIAYLPE